MMQQNQMAANQGLGAAFNSGFGMGNTANANMINAGSMYQKDLQNQYADAQRQFEGNRDFASNVYADFNSQILKGAPRTPARQTPNTVDPTAAALSGAMSGFGFGGQLQNMFSSPGGGGGGMPMGYNPYSTYLPSDYANPNLRIGIGTTTPEVLLHIQDQDEPLLPASIDYGSFPWSLRPIIVANDDTTLTLVGDETSSAQSLIQFTEIDYTTGEYENSWAFGRDTSSASTASMFRISRIDQTDTTAAHHHQTMDGHRNYNTPWGEL